MCSTFHQLPAGMLLHFMGHVQVLENKSLLYRARQHNTTAYEVLKGVMHSHSGVVVCRTGKVDSLPRHLHYPPSVGRHSSHRLEQHTPGERKLVAYLTFSRVYVLRNCQTYCHTFAKSFYFPCGLVLNLVAHITQRPNVQQLQGSWGEITTANT